MPSYGCWFQKEAKTNGVYFSFMILPSHYLIYCQFRISLATRSLEYISFFTNPHLARKSLPLVQDQAYFCFRDLLAQ